MFFVSLMQSKRTQNILQGIVSQEKGKKVRTLCKPNDLPRGCAPHTQNYQRDAPNQVWHKEAPILI